MIVVAWMLKYDRTMRISMTCRNEADRINSMLQSTKRLTALRKGFHNCWSLLVASIRLASRTYYFVTTYQLHKFGTCGHFRPTKKGVFGKMKPWLKFTPSDIEPLKIRSLDGAKRNPGSERKQSLFSTRIPLRFIQATDSFLQQSTIQTSA